MDKSTLGADWLLVLSIRVKSGMYSNQTDEHLIIYKTTAGGWYIVSYALGIYLLNLLIGFLSPQIVRNLELALISFL